MTIQRVGLVGSGIMGSGIAEVAAKAGFDVVLRSRLQATADAMVAGLQKSLAKQVERGKLDAEAAEATLARVSATDAIADLADCDLVIESVVEDISVKRALFAELDKVVKPGALLTTNTSTLSVLEMATATARPELVCGVHFFNPAPAMSLVEIVRPATASDTTIAAARGFAVACGKDAVDVLDRPGFIVNALLFPYLNNAVRIHEEGRASIADIDTAMKGGCNFPLGPFALLDLVGLDISVSILDALGESPAPTLVKLLGEGKLGRKTGEGFFSYRK
jgi:3-hydroxybutyryl-CoA dehydrogenase